MLEPIEQLKRPPRADECIRRGRFVGQVLALGLSLVYFCLMFVLGGGDANPMDRLKLGLTVSLMPDVLAIWVGSRLGKMAANCPTTLIAFMRGAFHSGLTIVIFSLSFFLFIFSSNIQLSQEVCLILFCLFLLLIASCSLVSGVAAIYVRDYYHFQRLRLIPQFTMREMFIAFTVVSVIISALTSLAVMRLW